MARRAGGAVVVALCFVAAALGTSMAGADELHVMIFPDSEVVASPGYTWSGHGLIWGWGDDVVCYKWVFSDTMTSVEGTVGGVRDQFEVSTPEIQHQFSDVNHHVIQLWVWWQKDGPSTAILATANVTIVELTITSETAVSAGDGTPDTRTELGIGELVVCTAVVEPPDAIGDFWWQIAGVGKPGPNQQDEDPVRGDVLELAAKLLPGSCVATAHIGLAEESLEFSVIEPDDITYALDRDDEPGEDGPPHNYIGCRSYFDYVVQPGRVSFTNASFREHWEALTFTWPDGTPRSQPAGYSGTWTVKYDNSSKTPDWCQDDWANENPPSRLGDGPADFEIRWNIPEEYQNEFGVWSTWLADEVHLFQYRHAPVKGAARAGIETSEAWFGGWMGPFKALEPH